MRFMFLLLLGCMLLLVTAATTHASPLPPYTMSPSIPLPHKPTATPQPTPFASPLPLSARDYLIPLKRKDDGTTNATPRKAPTTTPRTTPTATPRTTPIATSKPTPQPTMPPIASGIPAEPVRMVIVAIGLDQPVFAVGLDADNRPIVLKHDIGWYQYSAMPGTGENVVLWGHVLRFRDSPTIAAPFANLHHVTVGTPIVLTSANGTSYTYVVVEHIYATPNQVDYILPQGKEMLTLVSCIGEQVITDTSVEMSHRLITRALPMP